MNTTVHEYFPVVLMCDDVRKETNKKRTIVGSYGGDVLVQHFPASLPIAFYMHFVPQSTEAINVELFISVDDDPLANAKATLSNHKAGDAIAIDLPQTFVQFTKPAVVKLEASIENGPKLLLISKRIHQGEVTG